MARKPRIHFPGAVFHVILRGNAGQPIFFDERDRYRLYLILQYVVERFGCRIHGFCFMTNHIHLIMQTGDVSLSRIMQNLSLRFTKWINFTQSRTGHVFQGRYKALLLDADAYLTELVRYVHLNPVRAGLVASPADYPWSGHRGYLGNEMLPWLTTDWVLSMYSADMQEARQKYGIFVAEGIGETRRNEYHNGTCEGLILGDDNFADEALTKSNQRRNHYYRLDDIVNAVCRRYEITTDQLKAPGKVRYYSQARAVAALLVRDMPGTCLTELGKMVNRNIAPLGRSAQRLLEEMTKNEALKTRIDELRREISK